MGYKATLLLLLLVVGYGVSVSMGYREEGEEEWGSGEREGRGREKHPEEEEPSFLLQDSKKVFRTDAGEMRVVRSFGGRIVDRPMHIGFITMEPQSLFIPQYLDSSLIIFIRLGEAKIGHIYKDELSERRMKPGDIYRIPAGSAFYIVNTAEGQRLQIICSIDPSESLGLGLFQSFYIGGGSYPPSILAGFDPETLTNAFNVTRKELGDIFTRQQGGPVVFIGDSRAPRVWSKFLQLKEKDRLQPLKRMVGSHQESIEQEDQTKWSWRKLLISIFGEENRKKGDRTGKAPDSYNIYHRSPDFRNRYGSSMALDASDYSPLKHSGIGIFYVNLTAGSMLAPHVNPTATEYGIVLRGSGRILLVFPNGSSAMDAKVSEGDVFWVPRYFAFCQIASRTGPFEFFGFTTSARKNKPQFLAGSNSLLHALQGPELAASLGISEDRIKRFLESQREAVILPSASAAPPEMKYHKEETVMPKIIKSFENDMIMGFD
ncbi:hypothetical protein HS088_TW07G00259 [Tripterygium wilfordii]|uniref:Cupin type-1 domain-containing protein n=1 Tax=Tripterygium wilfordii TaxID=458696 RepID=A0A7J7DED1_TRIWF|nr:vicilin-like seed storage protein At2g28490 [Tripterygium wilfordii]KAF5744682.1 hypothetical protein HS088_TW07G00259 [Tripterygium wilfordii]